jgi:UDP-glucose:(heptosyl)LPS alpha-1,3-glucosyltransferase
VNLGVLLDRFDPAAGGAERHTDALLRRAVEQGERVTLATLQGEGPPGVTTRRIDAPRRRPARDRVFAEKGVAELRGAGCDVLLAFRHVPTCDVYLPHGGLVEDAIAAREASDGGHRFLSRVVRALSGKHRFFRDTERALLAGRTGPRVIALSRRQAGQVAAWYPAAAPRTVVIPNGVDAQHFDAAPFRAARAEVRRALGVEDAYLGLLIAHRPRLKGLETIFHAMVQPKVRPLAPAFHLLVVGRDVDGTLRRLPKRLGIESRVRWHGLVDDPRPLYAAADVLVQPTWHDPCSLTCLEALAMSLPVITTVQNGVSELMGQRGGIAIEGPGDPVSLATAIAVLADPDLRRFTADDARYVAEKNRQSTRLDQVLDVCRAAVRTA